MTPATFRKKVLAYYEKNGRHTLPWRKTRDPYKILVSEIMLQQTQVERVIPYYKAWIEKYPRVQILANAPLADVLSMWQGLGYNRRAKMLHEASKIVVSTWNGVMPKTVFELESLPGVGTYTAGAVAAFAYNQDAVFIETNIRTAVLHHFYAKKTSVSDSEMLSILENALPAGNSREWHAALMDYGAYLKRSGIRTNAQSKSYAKQKKFKGSAREVRGALVRALSGGAKHKKVLISLFNSDRTTQVEEQLSKLLNEGLVSRKGFVYTLPT